MQNKPFESTVLLNGEQPKKELSILAQKSEDLRKKYANLDEESKKFGIDTPERWKIEKEMEKVAKQSKAAEKEVKQLTKGNFDLKKVLDDLSGSSLKDLNKAQKDLSRQMSDGSIKRGTKEWTDHVAKLQSVKTEIASVKSEVNENSTAFGRFGKKLADIPGPAGQAIQSVKGFGTALKLLLLNPVGLAIAAVVAGLMLMAKAFMATDSGANMFAGVMKALGNIMDVILDRTMSYIKLLGSIATFDMEGIKKNGQAAFGGIAKSIKEAAKAGYDYVQVMDSIDDREAASLIRSAKLRAEIEKLKNEAKDSTKPIEERIRLNNLAMQKEKELLGIEKGFMKEKLDAEINNLASMVQVQGMSVTQKRQQVKEWLKLDDRQILQYAENNKRFGEFYDKNEDAFKKLQKMKAEEFDKDAEFESGTRRLQKESIAFKVELLKDESDKQKELAAKKKKLTAEEIEQKKKLKEENAKLLKEMTDLAISDLERSLEQTRFHDRELLAGRKLTLKEEHLLKLKSLQEDKKLEIDKIELSGKSEKEITDLKKLVNQKYRTLTAEENASFDDKEAAKALLRQQKYIQDQLELNVGNLDKTFDLERIMRESAMEDELKLVEKGSKEEKAIRDKYRKKEIAAEGKLQYDKQQLVVEYAQKGLDVATNLNSFITALGDAELAEFEKNNKGKANFDEEYAKKKAQIEYDEAVRAKGIGALSTIISTAAAVIGALAPPPIGAGPIAGIPLAILAGASGAIQLATILAAPLPQLYTGGFTEPGDKYKPAGIVHAGEFVANQDAVRSTPMRKVFNLIDHAQRTNTVAKITSEDIARVVSSHKGFSNGGYTSQTQNQSGSTSTPVDLSNLVAVMQQTSAVNAALLAQLQAGIVAKAKISGNDGIAKGIEDFNKLINNAKR